MVVGVHHTILLVYTPCTPHHTLILDISRQHGGEPHGRLPAALPAARAAADAARARAGASPFLPPFVRALSLVCGAFPPSSFAVVLAVMRSASAKENEEDGERGGVTEKRLRLTRAPAAVVGVCCCCRSPRCAVRCRRMPSSTRRRPTSRRKCTKRPGACSSSRSVRGPIRISRLYAGQRRRR